MTESLVFAPDRLWSADRPGALSNEAIAAYRENGVLVLRRFFDTAALLPIQKDIAELVRLQMERVDSLRDAARRPDYDFLRDGAVALARADRTRVGKVYDASMKLTSVRALGTDERSLSVSRQFLGSELLAMSNNTIVRIDLPDEEKFLFNWHQDYPYSMVSRHGIVFWFPLLDVSADMGPVVTVPGSHKGGLLALRKQASGQLEVASTASFEDLEPFQLELGARDVVVFDLMMVHRSARNSSPYPRWSVTYRYCDMYCEQSANEGWPCYYSQGTHFSAVHPDYVKA
jgi:ectoine hydroxylase-related dioxygenase (phytanoyl-CoA dioxygenase family)